MRYIIFVILLFFLSCQSTPRVVYQTNIPEYSCPQLVDVVLEDLSSEKSEEENLLIRHNNLAMTKRLIDNLIAIIACHERNLSQIRNKGREINKEEEKKTDKEK